MQWAELRRLIRELVGDPERSGGSLMRFSLKNIVDSANFAMDYYVTRTECMRTTQAMTVSAGKIDLTAIPNGGIKAVVVSGKPLDKTTYEFEEMRNPAFTSETGTANKRWLLIDGNKIMLVPPVVTGVVSASVTFIDSPVAITEATADNTEIDPRIPVEQHKHLKYLAASYLNRIGKPGMEEIKEDAFIKTFLDMSGV